MMKYKGYSAHLEYDDHAKVFFGEVIGIKDVVTFQGTSVSSLEQSFKDSINLYLAFCKKKGEKPDRPFSGKFNLRIPPSLHAKLYISAQLQKLSLNSYILSLLEKNINL